MTHLAGKLMQVLILLFCAVSLIVLPPLSPLEWPAVVAHADDDDGGDDDGGDDDGDDGGGGSSGGAGGSSGGGGGGSGGGSGGSGSSGGDSSDGDRGGGDSDGWNILQTPTRGTPAKATTRPIKDNRKFEPGRVLAVNAQKNTLNRIRQLGFSVSPIISMPALQLTVHIVTTSSQDMTALEALEFLKGQIPKGFFVLNDKYRIAEEKPKTYKWETFAFTVMEWQHSARCGEKIKIGMVDTAVDMQLPALAEQRITTKAFAEDGRNSSTTHGTAVAAILVGSAQSEYPGLMPQASLYAADTFTEKNGLHTTALMLAQGLDWLLTQKVSVINASIAGPDNELLRTAVDRVAAKKVAIVAAAGNGGPKAPPAYPAAYGKSVSVTAVDYRLRPYKNANRGDYLTVAAPGVGIWTPGWAGGKYRTGTSYAAPHVTAVVALILKQSPSLDNKELHRRLQQHSYDLGAPGKDPVFGWGLLKAPMACD